MAKTRLELTAQLNRMKAATAAAPITPTEFADFLNDWVNYMTNDGAYSAGVLEQWKTDTLNLQNANLNANIQAAINAATQALASANSAVAVAQGTATARPSSRFSFGFDFANSRFWDKKIPFYRNSIATYYDKNGLMRVSPINKPRFQHDSINMQCTGLLVEEGRTNNLLHSSDFTQTAWTKIRTTVSASTSKGVYTNYANKIVSTGENDPSVSQDINLNAANKTVTFSVYLWTDESTPTKATLRVYGKTTNEELATKVVTVTNIPTIFFITKTFSSTAVSTQIVVRVDPFEGETDIPTLGRYMYINAAQFELGAAYTSYIDTTSAIVSRGADSLSISGTLFSELFPTTSQGTILLSATKSKINGNYNSYALFKGIDTTGGRNEIRLYNDSTLPKVSVAIYCDGNLESLFSFDVAEDTVFSIALAWKKNDAKVFLNGIASADNFTVNIPNFNQFLIESGINTSIAQIMYWPRRVANSAIQALTSVGLSGKNPQQIPSISDLFGSAFTSPYSALREQGKVLLKINGTGAQVTDNINLPYDFNFEILTPAGATFTSTPNALCTAGTDNLLVVTVPLGKTLWYAITPVFEF